MADEQTQMKARWIRAEVKEVVWELIFELASNPRAPRTPTARLKEDLDYHSLGLLELAFTLEDEFDLEPIDEEVAQSIQTVGDVVDHVLEQLSSRGDLAA